jgi:hypothetical protein
MAEAYKIPILCNFEALACYKCGIAFAVDAEVNRVWRTTGNSFYCPNGHGQHYTETDIQKLKKQLEREKRNTEWAQNNAKAERAARERTEKRLAARKGANTKLRNRIKNGVCPCCTRSFINLREHIATKHPDFKPDDEASPVNGPAE